MIARLEGKVVYKGMEHIIIDVAGVGYQVYLTAPNMKTVPVEGQSFACMTYLYVRENALELYGFANQSELEFFNALLTVSGIGPKSAMGILNVAPIDLLKRTIASGEAEQLTVVSGIGKKTAQKIVVELRDKLGAGMESEITANDTDTLAALQSLGYSPREAREVLQKIPNDIEGTEARLSAALRELGK